MNKLQQLRDQYAAEVKGAKSITDTAKAEDRDLTAEEATQVDGYLEAAEKLDAEIKALEANSARFEKAEEAYKALSKATPKIGAQVFGGAVPPANDRFVEAASVEFPIRKRGRLQHMGRLSGLSAKEQEDTAGRFGMWFLATRGHQKAQEWCKHNIGIDAAVHKEGTNTVGGYLVPDEFDPMLIDLREQYGVFRPNAKVVRMNSETWRGPRRTGGLTAYFVGEDTAITESNKTWDEVSLVAKDLYVISRYTAQLNDDAVVNIGDDLAGEISYAFAKKEDQCGFLGDGTSTYGGITGLKTKVTAATAGLVSGAAGTAASWAGVTLANFNSMVGLLPQFADTPNTAWYCHKAFYGGVIQKVQTAAGGNDIAALAAGGEPRFLGYPVRVSQVLSAAAGTAEVVCYLGDLSLAAHFGDRRGTSISYSTDAYVNSVSLFERNEIAIRGWERFDINVHDVGDTTAAGPVVGLLTVS